VYKERIELKRGDNRRERKANKMRGDTGRSQAEVIGINEEEETRK
jgi:hypothetical protein